MPTACFSRARSAFTLVESLVMLVLLSVFCMVAIAVGKTLWTKPAPASSVKDSQIAPLDANARERPSSTPRKQLRDGAKQESSSKGN